MILSVGDIVSSIGSFFWEYSSPFGGQPRVSTSYIINVEGNDNRYNPFGVPVSNEIFSLGSCDANALASCMRDGDADDLLFVDLDIASYNSFQRFNGEEARLLLFYEPSFLDHYFHSTDEAPSAVMLHDGIPPMTIGRVDCIKSPRLCSSVNSPILQVVNPQSLPKVVSRGDHVFTYPTSVRECLWRRHGAEALTSQCSREMNQGRHETPNLHSLQYIQEGKRIALLWNILIILTCFVLLAALVLVGWKLLRKCLARCCQIEGLGNVARSSAQMSKEERKQQLEQQITCFYFAAVAFSFTSIMIPPAIMFVAGPVAVAAWLWLWCVEFKGACVGSCSTPSQATRAIAPAQSETVVALLSDEEETTAAVATV